MKLARSNPFRLYLIEKDKLGMGEGKWNDIQVKGIGNQLTLKSHPPNPELISFFDKTYIQHVSTSNQNWLLSFGIFQCFY